MKVTARVQNERGKHEVTLVTDGQPHTVSIPPKDSGFGSKANGGELLFLALATCYCNDIYREAGRRNIQVNLVEVEVTGDFGGPGEPAQNVTYRAKVTAKASRQEIHDLMVHTDQVAEVHNSLRQATQVILGHMEPESVTET